MIRCAVAGRKEFNSSRRSRPCSKDQVLSLGREIGFDAVDAGPLQNARWIESLGFLNIQLGYMLKMGTQIGFKLIH